MIRNATLVLSLASIPAGAAAEAAYAPLIARYAAACQRLSAAECRFSSPPSAGDAERLGCFFRQLDARAGEGTAASHVAWAEGYATSGQPPPTGFPAGIGDQQTLVAALLACGAQER